MIFSRQKAKLPGLKRSMYNALLASLVLPCLLFSVASADDTEIFFSLAEGDPSTNPNIVFILDNSGSMSGRVSGTRQTKMAAMQAAMNEIIDSVDNINLGLVNFKVGDPQRGSEMVFPVTPIGDPGVRQAMKNVVNGMRPRTATPLVGALYESTMILTGGNIEETSARYTSPMVGECQNNHIVMLSDGQAWGNNAVNKTENLIGRTCPGRSAFERCGVELAQWLNDTDHVPAFSRDKNITVSTIGFNIRSTFLDRVAAAGGGEYYEASRSSELVNVFNEIITTVKDIDTTFVAPATSINQYNRLTQSNDLYFSLFKPKSSTIWPGNLKRYQLGLSGTEVVIVDAAGDPAVDPATGLFRDDARSFWSDSPDGSEVEAGGAAAELVAADRRIYTHVGAIPAGGVNLDNALAPGSPAANFYLGSLPAVERDLVIRWVRGEDVMDEVPGIERRHMGDILHSSPVTVNYPSGNSLVFVGTNEGFLHAIRRDNGKEEFSFIPQELISNLIEFYTNSGGATSRPYGLDGDITLLHDDNNGDSIVNNGESAYLYVGMRRGGNNYYALDVSNPNSPRLMWKIDGGSGRFARLGQTWSKPIATQIQYNGGAKSVLIFGGGYDTNQDPENNPNGTDSVGNTIYIVDAETGQELWNAYDDVAGVSADMRYSIPSDLRVIDINGDSYADRIYVGDVGGLVWRFDLKPYHQSSDGIAKLAQGGVFADLRLRSGNRNRFFNEPDVALISHEGKRFMSVSIGTGWRSHPLFTGEVDYFYMLRDNSPLATPPSMTPLRLSELTDISNSLSDDRGGEADMQGWRLKLDTTGEKNLSRSITINNQVLFSTYAPIPPSDVCSPPSGRGFVYAVDVVHGDPVLPLNSGGGGTGSLSTRDRKKVLSTESIPPSPSATIADVGGEIRTNVMVGTETPLSSLPFSDLTKRTYWQDRRRGSSTPAACRAGSC